MKTFHIKKTLFAGILCLGLTRSAFADTIYSNATNDLNIRFNPGTAEIGDEIILAGTSRYLTQFDFEYWGTNTANPFAFSGAVQARVKFYLNDGPLFNGVSTPGTVFYDSGLFGSFGPTARNTLVFTIAGGDFPSTGLYIPASDITWSVQFFGLGGTDSLGVDLYNPSTVGANFPDYWQNSGGGWQLLTNSVGPMNFGARFFANADPVPEPSMAALTIVGVICSFGLARWKIRNKN